MIESPESIWTYFTIPDHFVCLTTNGTVKKNGRAVMGRGNAKQATIVVPDIELSLGRYIRTHGNVAGLMGVNDIWDAIVIFPVKHNWWEKADHGLILKSTAWLLQEAERNPSNIYHLPRPGCGNGQLNWERDVKRLVSDLPDNVWVHHIENIEEQTNDRPNPSGTQ